MTRINTPKEVLALAGSSAADKLQNTAGKTLILAFLAGAYIAIGGLFSLMAGFGFPGAAEAPGFQRLLSGAVFPLGLILVVFTGAELFTGNCLIAISLLERQCTDAGGARPPVRLGQSSA